MRQDVRSYCEKEVPIEAGWFARFKGLVDYGRALLTAAGEGVELNNDNARLISERPTWKEANVSVGPTQQLQIHIRWMIRRDMPEVLEVERKSFEFPWFEEDFIRCLRQRNCIGMVAEHGERVVGFMIYELHKTRLHILNFAVAETVRRRGVGTQMANKLISKLSGQRRTRISLEVRETNLTAQMFFKALDFRATSVLRSYYDDSPEDAYVMQYRYVPDEIETVLPINRIDRLAG